MARGLAAVAALLGGLIGIPAALVALAGNPLPHRLAPAGILDALLRPDDGTILVGLVAVVGWLAWLAFAAASVAEIITIVSGRRWRIRLPGLGGPQRWVAGLLITIAAMTAAPQLTSSPPVAVAHERVAAPTVAHADRSDEPVSASPEVPVPAAPGAHGERAASGPVHTVVEGDDLWTLAEQYYGQGRDWRKIAAANPDRLSGGPDRLVPGWKLAIPDAVTPPGGGSVVVRAGDSLSRIADRTLGDADRWPEIFDANRAQLSDPDQLDVGVRLEVPAEANEPHPEADHPVPPPTPRASQLDRVRPAGETRAHSSPSAPTAPRATSSAVPTAPAPTEPVRSVEGDGQQNDLAVAAGLAATGGVLAAGLLAGLAWRRRIQLQTRPLGRRVLLPAPPAAVTEAVLGKRQRPMSLRTLDLALRAISAHCHHTGAPLPSLELARISDDQIELVMAGPTSDAPVGFHVTGRTWVLTSADADYLRSIPGVGEAARQFPALVSLGRDDAGADVLVDLESLGLLTIATPDHVAADALVLAIAVELSFALWSDELVLTVVGGDAGLVDGLDRHNVSATDDLDALLDQLETRARSQLDHLPEGGAARGRSDPDRAESWTPEIVLVNQDLTADQERRLVALTSAKPRSTVAAVVARPVADAPFTLTVTPTAGHGLTAELSPYDLTLTPQQISVPAAAAIVDLVTTTGSEETTPAPWWDHTGEPPHPPPDNVTYLGRRAAGWGRHEQSTEGSQDMGDGEVIPGLSPVHHPTLRILGPVELVGETGTPPPRAAKQCLEYCGWLLEHPGTTAQAMASGLVVAEGTRRSNMSRLRTWLGDDPAGEAYLPDAYTGRIKLHPAVSSDWQRLQILTAAGVNGTSSHGLRMALDLVRGAPLADAAPGQWHWAEELRTDMISVVRDIGVELTARALDQGDLDLARWAAARALVVAPGDELLLAARIRTEHQAGNANETERLTLQLATQARTLGVDLDAATVELLQEVMEGRVRARFA